MKLETQTYTYLFPAQLCVAREFVGLTQTQLAKKIGITQQSVGEMERGEIYPSLITTAKIFHLFKKHKIVFDLTL